MVIITAAWSNHSKERRQDASQCVSLVYPEKTHVPTFRPECIIPKNSKAMGSEREKHAMLTKKNAFQCAMMLLYARNQALPRGTATLAAKNRGR